MRVVCTPCRPARTRVFCIVFRRHRTLSIDLHRILMGYTLVLLRMWRLILIQLDLRGRSCFFFFFCLRSLRLFLPIPHHHELVFIHTSHLVHFHPLRGGLTYQ